MSQRPTPPTPEELAERIREWRKEVSPLNWSRYSELSAVLLADHGDQIASYLEELSTLRRQLAEADAVLGAPDTPPPGWWESPHREWAEKAIIRHASRTERTP